MATPPNQLGAIRPAHDATAALAAMLPQREAGRWGWLPRLPKWLDPLSITIALKTCVGLVIGVTIALWLGWSATGVGFACIMLQTAYLGRTLGRSILRMAGALAGSLLALAFVATLVQEGALLIGAYAIVAGLIIYAEQESEHPYALLFVLLSVGLITFGTIYDPQNAFSEAVSWVSGNALGVAIVLFMHGVLWPHTGESSFEHQLETYVHGLSRLFALKITTMPQEARQHDEATLAAVATECRELENRLMAALIPLRLALGIASRDTDRFIRFQAAYADLVEQLQSLTSVIMSYGDTLRIWRGTALAGAVVPQSPVPHLVLGTIRQQLDDLAAACEQPRDGSAQGQAQDAPESIRAQTGALRQSLRSQEHSVLEAGLFDAVSEKAIQLSRTIASVRQALATAEQPGRHIDHAPKVQIDSITQIKSLGLRLQKAVIGAIAVLAASLLWINLNWPDPGSFLVFVLLPVALNAMLPIFPIKAGLKSLFWGPAIGALLYFVIMPSLSDMWQLAPLLILCLLPTTYLTNSANPGTMLFGLLSSLWAFVLIDISQGQVYAFESFANTTIGIVGAVGVGLAALVFLNPLYPERQFKLYVHTLLRRCERAIAELRRPGRAVAGQHAIATHRAEWLELVGLCALWARQLDPARHSENERAKVDAFIASLRSLAFRLEALEEARALYTDESLIETAAEHCRADAIAALRRIDQALSASGASATSAPATTVDAFREALEPMRTAAHQHGDDDDRLHQVLTLTGYYTALTDAVEGCRQRAGEIDWRRWDLAYF